MGPLSPVMLQTAANKTLVVWGLGGAVKTQLVLDYVRQHRAEYKATFWIEAARKESLERYPFSCFAFAVARLARAFSSLP
ncbi:hypothetical protein PTT_18230 [Pyrenophora teres f. teres 0-1]|uniref:Uncharacterized protein n=1 Tax=Pyrenophora teres f. teres (strain 0-1) TaxID=861557 RepID=E3S692_PYRTT|nr:hypothetical protein PTT_18230 [Pyrenophora teres f. teres 0-1]